MRTAKVPAETGMATASAETVTSGADEVSSKTEAAGETRLLEQYRPASPN
jgi:hypothetical protein